MSMNFSEFKKLLGADPWNRDQDVLQARNSAPEFEQAAVEAEVFERKLQSALQVDTADDLLKDILQISRHPAGRRNWMPLALAASLFLAVGAASVIWQQSHRWDTVESYIAEHYAIDGTDLIARATGPVSDQDISKILTSLHATAGSRLAEKIRFIKFCPTPHGRGAHMVVSTDLGPVTIIFMPENDVVDGEMVNFDGLQAYLIHLEHGSAAIIGQPSQHVASLRAVVVSSLKTGQADV